MELPLQTLINKGVSILFPSNFSSRETSFSLNILFVSFFPFFFKWSEFLQTSKGDV